MLLTCSGYKPGILLKILQLAEHPPTAKNDLVHNVNGVEVEKSCSKGI